MSEWVASEQVVAAFGRSRLGKGRGVVPSPGEGGSFMFEAEADLTNPSRP